VDFSAGPQDFTVTAQNGTTQVYRVTVAKNAWYSFTLAWTPGEGFADLGEEAFTAENPVLSKSGPNSTADIEITGSFAACEWYVDSSLKGQGAVGTTVRLDAQNYLTGSHQLDIIVYDAEGIPYAKGLSFEVEE
ncbi:MAG: hypothetical protein LBD93_02545, partial [Treponema sp.]|nr:hypothetical protein [Treponema sp.]